MPVEAIVFVIVIVGLAVIYAVKALNEPTDARFPNSTVTDMTKRDYSCDRLKDFAEMLSCSNAINTVNGERVPFDVYIKKDGPHAPMVHVELKYKTRDREWVDIDFILDGYILTSLGPFKTYSYGKHSGEWWNREAVSAIAQYEARKEQGLKYTGRKSDATSYEYKVTCDRS